MDKNNQLARIIGLLNEHGYEINDREIDETNAFEAVELVLAQLVDAHAALDAVVESRKSNEAVIIPPLNQKPGNGKTVPLDMQVNADTKPITVKLPLAVSVGGQGFREQVVDILTEAGIKVEEAE
ncbi:hypothetical protein D6W19_003112 [Escherichia coli]|nr:hypothetical protein [Escherichia coli]